MEGKSSTGKSLLIRTLLQGSQPTYIPRDKDKSIKKERIILTSETTSKTINFESGHNLMNGYNKKCDNCSYVMEVDDMKKGLGSIRENK